MAYITQDDYTRAISITNLQDILNQAVASAASITASQAQANAENMAYAEVNGYLSNLFNTAAEFQKTFSLIAASDTRDQIVLMCVIKISLYHLHMSVNPNDVPDDISVGYKMAHKWLENIEAGTMRISVPRNPISGTGGERRIELYSNKKFVSKPYDDASILNPEQFQTDNQPIVQTQQ